MILFFVIASVFAVVFGLLTRWIAIQKGRSESEGFWLGFGMGVIGCLVELLLPQGAPALVARREAETRARLASERERGRAALAEARQYQRWVAEQKEARRESRRQA